MVELIAFEWDEDVEMVVLDLIAASIDLQVLRATRPAPVSIAAGL